MTEINNLDIENFSRMIEELAEKLDVNYLETIVHYCEKNEMEIEVAAQLISSNLKAKIESLAVDLHYLKNRGSKLPL